LATKVRSRFDFCDSGADGALPNRLLCVMFISGQHKIGILFGAQLSEVLQKLRSPIWGI
jgi:hypothetical protein